MSIITLDSRIKSAAQALAPVSTEAMTEARILVEHALRKRNISGMRNEPFPEEAEARLAAFIARRLTGEPLQYILGEWEFMGLSIKTDARALIPRQDTETLCEEALSLIPKRGYISCLDLCCGTGCIGIALAKLGGVKPVFADISAAALALARENCTVHGVEAQFIQSDLLLAVMDSYDIIACNPPYLTQEDMRSLQAELEFEPANALFGGDDGLEFYRRLALDAPKRVSPGGTLLMEVGMGQAEAVAKLFPGSRTVRDINGIERVVIWEKGRS